MATTDTPTADISAPAETETAPESISDETRSSRLEALTATIEQVAEAVRMDGGDLVLVYADVETGIVDVELQGACSSCAVSSYTMAAGVERILQDRFPWITEIRGGLGEDTGVTGTGGWVPQ